MADLTQIPAGVLAMLQQKLSTSAQIGAPVAGPAAPSSAPPPDITAAVQAAGSAPQPSPPPNIASFIARNPQAQNEVAGQIQQAGGGAPSAQPDPELKPPLSVGQPAPDAPEQMGDAVDRLSAPVGAGAKAPALAPQPKPHTSLMSHILPFLQAAGVLGGGLAAAGDRQHGQESVNALESTFQSRNAALAKQRELEQVEIPKAQATVAYLGGKNDTAESVAQTRADASKATTAANVAGRAGVASTAANAKLELGRYKAIPGVGMFDTKTQQVIPGTAQGVTLTSEMAQQYDIPVSFVGKPVKLTDLAGMENAQSRNIAPVMGAAGPALANKKTGTAKTLGLGSPGVAARQAGVSDVYDENGNLSAMTDAQRLATGTPKAGTEFSQQGPTSASRNMSQMARTITPHLNTLRDEVKELAPYLGPLMGRGEVNFAAGTVGSTGNPELDYKLGRLMSDFKLASSAVGRTHFAGRTGLPAAQYFGELFNAKRSPEELMGVLDSVPSYIEGYTEMQNFKPARVGGQTGGGGAATPAKTAPKAKAKNDPLGIL